jgi:hypothetical protein
VKPIDAEEGGPDETALRFYAAQNQMKRVAAEIERLRGRHPGARVMIYPKRGGQLARELKWLGSYRYGVCNVGGASVEEMVARFAAVCADIDFHPRAGLVPGTETATAAALGDD